MKYSFKLTIKVYLNIYPLYYIEWVYYQELIISVTNSFGIYVINVHSHWINIRVVLIRRLSPPSIFLDRYVISIVGGSESHAT